MLSHTNLTNLHYLLTKRIFKQFVNTLGVEAFKAIRLMFLYQILKVIAGMIIGQPVRHILAPKDLKNKITEIEK